LDVTVQAQILDILRDLQRELNLGLALVTHDLGVVAGMADRVSVMYSGRLVETAAVDDLFADPRHPYTRGLIASIPRLDTGSDRLVSIEGSPPPLTDRSQGCAFAPRCPLAADICRTERPELRPAARSISACHFAGESDARAARTEASR
ncbi:MAG: oligopeptide/dipeptide ABC transporter ATP-binding protein, partial [Limibaculum sp.]